MKIADKSLVRGMYVVLVVLLLGVQGQVDDDEDEWIDPYDMINYDATSKSMKKQPGVVAPSQPSPCLPVFKRFLSKLLKEVEKLGLPSEVKNDVHYDAEVRLSRQAVVEIQKLLEGADSWRTGALDDALSQILVNFKPHDHEAWKWRFEDTFGVELDTVLKIFLGVLCIVLVICSELWSTVSWFVQFRRMFAICFFISIVWNWFYLYKIAFAEHQNNIVKMESVNEKCTGVKKIDWQDNLKEWFRSTWTLQDDPCKRYYEVLMVNPILLVPPTKAISVTITTFITEPLKHFGQGISEFLRALLKDLPVTLQIPVLLTIVLSILVFMYGSAQTAIHAVAWPLRGGRQDPPPAAIQQRRAPQLRDEESDEETLAGGDAPPPPRRPVHQGQNGTNLRQRRPNRAREERLRVRVETLGNSVYSEDELDSRRRRQEEEQPAEEEQEEDSPQTIRAPKEEEKKKKKEEEKSENVAAGVKDGDLERSQTRPNAQSPKKEPARNTSDQGDQKDEQATAPDLEKDVQRAPWEKREAPNKEDHVDTIKSPVQETTQ
ncbi:chloride channel CLIC-like protein 1 isoform X2 [Chanos chanos]|uniref:Chloride channel CLIC-like protein 1 n=1 Tax=Chanos chanos TaxID=29144 RepID=A0A6J2W979_CHACN|nr:chloride channel CLIC-like protein 1 isoform X2 [Chanos chanos]